MHVLVEAELPAIEVDRCVDVVDDIADAYLGHMSTPVGLGQQS